jgi:hypothetical protein
MFDKSALIMQNKANFRNDKMNIYLDITSIYKIFCCSPGPKNKANSKPIKPKTNPIQTQFNPKQTQTKPISKAKCLRIWLNYGRQLIE